MKKSELNDRVCPECEGYLTIENEEDSRESDIMVVGKVVICENCDFTLQLTYKLDNAFNPETSEFVEVEDE